MNRGTAKAALGDLDGAVHVCDLATGRRCFRGRGHEDYVAALAVSADGRTLLSGSDDGTALVWDVGRLGLTDSPR